MELKPGYKMTEAGVIPEDWMSFELGKYGNLQKQVITPSSYPNQIFYEYSMPAFDDGEKPAKIYGKEIHSNKTKITGEVILFNKLNVRQRRVWLVNNASNNAICSTEFLSYKTKKVTLNLLKQILLTDKVTIYFENKSTGTSNSQKRITPNTFLEFKCCVPQSLTEQQAIAAALSDVDELLNSLDQLIAKKKDIRLAAMQELLTGKTRLPGFSETWQKKTLGELGFFIKGKGISRAEANSGSIPCIRYGEIYTHHNNIVKKFHSFISHEAAQKSIRLKTGDILFTCSGETKEDIGKSVAFTSGMEAYAGGDIIILRNTTENSNFLGYRLNASDISLQKSSAGQGDAVVHISSTSLSNICVTLPSTHAEQQAIASVLSDMDDEIEALEARRDKVRHIKAGMMQELLTGKTRLISSGEEA